MSQENKKTETISLDGLSKDSGHPGLHYVRRSSYLV
jgi:hypothetical protein